MEPGRGAPVVRLVATHGVVVERRRLPVAPNRASGRIVHVVIVATSAFAFLDLFLLLSPAHH
jgi:hypothetical protein